MTLRILTLNLWNTDGPWPDRARRIGEWLDRLEPETRYAVVVHSLCGESISEVARQLGWTQGVTLLRVRDATHTILERAGDDPAVAAFL